MDSNSIWTAEDAAGDFVRVLKQARDSGPQEIRDVTGVYVLKAVSDGTKGDVAKSLMKLRPKG
ncbi:hypothetical protein HFO09_08895 [Rhizobium laguerreae]|uniref:hypothetical protein n=1 Tax=Rhizobium laguerreae TaxID=1076926 RepID=UPI001C8FFF74|nr:hypothetical protein [Rhizobium laguerreae]MBY3255802.1 hypothetical protein [Rhizobium laguerreae]MBY3282841.1 hypothetical protein [Rhizobium laguerreae]MBY3289195.1 hypothetical protein [Rhizobium laguerreae]